MSGDHEQRIQDLRRSVSLKLAITARQMRRHFDQAVAEHGVTRSQWTMISAVARVPGATQRTLAQVLEMSEASAGRLVDRLCEDGLLVRRPKNDDRRAYCVFMTPAGEALTGKLVTIASEHEAGVFRGLTAEDLKKLDALLTSIVSNVGPPRLSYQALASKAERDRRATLPPATARRGCPLTSPAGSTEDRAPLPVTPTLLAGGGATGESAVQRAGRRSAPSMRRTCAFM